MSLINCTDCNKAISVSAQVCPNCGRPNVSTPTKKRSISILLGTGIVLIPVIFAWFTLRKGYSTLAKVLSFSWLGLSILLVGQFDNNGYKASSAIKSNNLATKPKQVSQPDSLTGPQSQTEAADTPAPSGMSPALHPREYCELARGLGYPSRGYKAHSGGCSSEMTAVTPTPGRNGLENNLAFYVLGTGENATRISRVSLILNVNNVHEKARAQAELDRVATSVAARLVGAVPNDFSGVVKRAGSKRWTQGSWEIEVKSEVWPTGLGQDIRVYFRPR